MRLEPLTRWLVALPLLAGCVAEDTTRYTVSQQPIKGGYTDTEDKAVVGLVMFVGGGYGTCSGTLITPNIVLTAQHCIAPVENEVQGGVVCGYTSFGAPYDGDQIYITTDTVLSQDENNYYAVQDVVIPPGNELCGADIAILVLDEDVPSSEATPFPPRVDSPVAADPSGLTVESELYSAVGYGNTNDSWGWGGGGGSGERRRLDNLYVYCEGSACGEPDYIYDTEWMGDTGVCQGDSGGPALDAESRVIGVVSRGSQGCTSPVYTSVFGWRDWIMGVVVDASQSTGAVVPGWATGGATNTAWPIGDPCEDNADCFSGVCHEGMCSRQCTEEAPCPEGYGCHPDLGICVAPPVGPPCDTDAECEGGVCHEGMCTRPCTEGGCPDNYFCDDTINLCAPVPLGDPCMSGLDCDTGLCVAGLCSRLCGPDSLCPSPFGCISGLCQLPPLGKQCVVDEDCMGGFCIGGACTRACDEFPCDAPWECDVNSLMCTPPPAPEMPACEVEPCSETGEEGRLGGEDRGLDAPSDADPNTPANEDIPVGEERNNATSTELSPEVEGSSEVSPDSEVQALGEGDAQGDAAGAGCQGSGPSSPWSAALMSLILVGVLYRRRRALL